jgi:predicted RNA-binding Zn-ribbon protein involved in translation (DUF1610 family)
MTKQIMSFSCGDCNLMWQEYHSIKDNFYCPECGKKLYSYGIGRPEPIQHPETWSLY